MRCRAVLAGALVLVVAAGLSVCSQAADDRGTASKVDLGQSFDFAKARVAGTQYFDMVSTFTNIALDGTRAEPDVFRVKLECVSQGDAAKAGDEYTCKRFEYVRPGGTPVRIPALDGWRHTFRQTKSGYDEHGQVLGIDHAKFERLADADGMLLPPNTAYLIYNTFIDFHAFCDEFATPTPEGKGIQDLTRIGQRIVHSAANTTPPTSLGNNIKAGSWFKNGEITLAFKGLSIVDGAACAIVEFDSGACTFRTLMEATPKMEVQTDGGRTTSGTCTSIWRRTGRGKWRCASWSSPRPRCRCPAAPSR